MQGVIEVRQIHLIQLPQQRESQGLEAIEAFPDILVPENQQESFFAPVPVPTNIPVLLYGEEMRGLGETCTVCLAE